MDEIRKAAWAVQAKTIIKNLELRNMEALVRDRRRGDGRSADLIETGSSVTWAAR